MAKFGFRIRSKSSQLAPVYIYTQLPGLGRQEVKVGLLVKRELWNESTQRLDSYRYEDLALNNKLDEYSGFLIIQYNRTIHQGGEFEHNWLKYHVNLCFKRETFNVENNVCYQIEQYIESAPNRIIPNTGSIGLSSNTVNNYLYFLKIMKQYEAHYGLKLTFDKLDLNRINHLKHYLLSVKNYSMNNAGLQLRLLKIVSREAERKGIKVHPYTRHIQSFKQKKRDRYLQTLSFEEIEKIKALSDLPSALDNCKKWLLIGLYLGQRVSDLLNLQSDQIRESNYGIYVDMIQQKTSKSVTIGVIDPLIIHYLKEELPYKITPQLFNKNIKVICEKAGIKNIVKGYALCSETKRRVLGLYPKYSLISSHDLRRSFATNYFGKIETPLLMHITGHTKESTFLAYIGANINKDAYADAFMQAAAKL